MPASRTLPSAAEPFAPPPTISAETLVEEHRALHATIRAIETALQPPAADAGWRAHLLARLEDLKRQLEGHFGTEEASGIYGDLAEAGQQFAGAALRLRREHDDLRRSLDRLEADVRNAPLEELPRVAGRVRSLLRDLERHESGENELLSRTVDDGIGVGD